MAKQTGTERTELLIPAQTVVKTIAIVIATILLLAILKLTAHALLIIATAFFLALALNAPVSFIAKHLPGKARGNRAWATATAFLIVIVLLGGFLASIVPPLVRQTESLVNAAPGLVQDIRDQKGPIGGAVRKYHLQKQVDAFSKQLQERVRGGAGQAFSTIQRIGSSLFAMLTILALTYMMLIEGPRRLEFVHELIPARNRGLSKRMAADMYRVVKGYVNGQVTLAALASLLIAPALFILHVSYPVGLIVIIFICGLIPLFGHTIGAIIVTLVALFTSPTSAVIILAYYILYQQIENYLIQPRIQANSTDMSPLLVFGSVVIGVSFSGLFGGLVAIPVAGCIRVVLLEYLRSRHMIGDKPVVRQEIEQATGRTK